MMKHKFLSRSLSMLLCLAMVLSMPIPTAMAEDDAAVVESTPVEVVETTPQTQPEPQVSQTETTPVTETSAAPETSTVPETSPSVSPVQTAEVTESAQPTETKTETETETETETDEAVVTAYQQLTAHTDDLSQDDQAKVTVTGNLPVGAYVKISWLSENDQAHAAAASELDKTNIEYADFLALDISVFNSDGEEIEPDSTVSVALTLGKNRVPQEADPDTMTVVHMEEDETGEIAAAVDVISAQPSATIDVSEAGIDATFHTDSFSTFTITWNSSNNKNNVTMYAKLEDASGNEINSTVANVTVSSGATYYFNASSAPTISGYEFSHAYVLSYNNSKTTVTYAVKGTGSYKNYVRFYNTTSYSPVATLSAYNTIYLVYIPTSTDYTVNFNRNLTTSDANTWAAAQTYETCPSSVTLPAPSNTTLSSGGVTYTFAGWALNANGTGTLYQAGDTMTLSESNFSSRKLTFYAVWTNTYTVNFYRNYGNTGSDTTAFADAITVNSATAEITLPTIAEDAQTYTSGSVTYKFFGWATTSGAYSSNTQPLYPAGSTYQLSASNFNNYTEIFYAVWGASTAPYGVEYYIRLDGTIPVEPAQYSSSLYTDGIAVSNALYYYSHLYNTTDNPNAVASNLKNQPTNAQLSAVLSAEGITWDPDVYEVVWYVIKLEGLYSNGTPLWHVDGVLMEKAKTTLVYDANCTQFTGTVIPGLQYDTGAEVTVQGSWNGTTGIAAPLERAGYTFAGWNTAADGSGTAYAIGQTITMPETANTTVTLYAQWIPNANNSITITKQISGLVGGDTVSMTFTATNTENANDTHTAVLTDKGNGTYTATISGLTTDASYYITETGAEKDGYDLVTNVNPMTIVAVATGAVSVGVTNAYTLKTGTLVIEKTVTAENAARLANVVGALSGKLTFTYTKDGFSQTVTAQGADYDAGKYTITVSNVPIGEYTITEGNCEIVGYTLTPSGDVTAMVTQGETATAAFSNDYVLSTGSVTVTKNLLDSKGSFAEAKADASYLFEITGTTLAGESATYYVTVTVAKGASSGTATLTGVLFGSYTVSEVNAVNSTCASISSGFTLSDVNPHAGVSCDNTYDYHLQTSTHVAVNQFSFTETFWSWIRSI